MASRADQFLPTIEWKKFQPTNADYAKIKMEALELARRSLDVKKLKQETLVWASSCLTAGEVECFEEVERWRFLHIGKYHYILNRGGVLDDECVAWLAPKVDEILAIGVENLKKKQEIPVKPVIDPVVRDAAWGQALAMNMEDLILTDVYPEDHESAYNVLAHSLASPAVLRNVVNELQAFVDELNDFSDDEIEEGFDSRKKWQASKLAYEGLLSIAQTFTSNSKTRRKAAKKRKKNRTRDVKDTESVNFRKEHTELQLVSIDPSSIVGAKSVLVYNTKTRKIGLYISSDEEGLQVRGTTIHGYDEDKSQQKTLRKPEQQINSFRDATMRRCEIVITQYIKARATKMNGRLNEHVVIMKAWK